MASVRTDIIHTDERLERQLETLLSESIDSAKNREQTAFDQLASPFEQRLVLFGAGGLGKSTLAGLRKVGIEPLAFTDNNAARWGESIDGIPILQPSEAAARFGDNATVVVTIWSTTAPDTMPDRIRQMVELGCKRVIPAGLLFWKYPGVFLPYYSMDLPHHVIERAEAVRAAYRQLHDELSQIEFIGHVRYRLHLDFSGLPQPARHDQYFPHDLIELRDHEIFVDCGAFDGDSIGGFVQRTQGRFTGAIAFEPDSLNCDALRSRICELPSEVRNKITVIPAAVGAASGTLLFNVTGTASSSTENGSVPVRCVALDEALDGWKPTFIKMDIEGAEVDALQGARAVIARERPILAVCAYHTQAHLWEIPIWISAALERYRVFYRSHSCDAWELVCYAIPVERVC
jgi:FkbM family methyltransferase